MLLSTLRTHCALYIFCCVQLAYVCCFQLAVWQQAAYTALQEFEAQFPSTGEEVIRLKEEIYALLEERAQHATQRKWRQMQKKRARDTAAANARNQRRSSGSEAAAQTSTVSFNVLLKQVLVFTTMFVSLH